MPVTLSRDLPPAMAIPVRCGEADIALWRSAAGRLAAWADRCPHRGMRLSHGFVRGEMLSCIYHGWRYDGEGVCRKIPAHPGLDPPSTIRAETFRVTEMDGVVWVAPVGAPEVEAPRLPEGLVPLRSLEVAVAERSVRAHLGAGQGPIATEGLTLLLQAQKGERTTIHAFVAEGGAAASRAASRRLEALRRALEAAA